MTHSAAILAGGLSSRFGSHKFLAGVGGETLIRRVARAVTRSAGELLIVTSQDAEPELDAVLATEIAGLGIIARIVRDTPGPRSISAGIEAALLNAASDTLLVAGADLPFLSPEFMEYQIQRSLGHDGAVPFYRGFYEPACAVFTRGFLSILSPYRHDPKGPVSRLFEDPAIDVVRISEDEIRAFGDPDLLFLNVNTKDDLHRARALLSARGEPK